MKRSIARYGWRRDTPDIRDHTIARASAWPSGPFPARVDLRLHCPPIYDQLALGACTANAIIGAVQFDEMKQHENPAMLSRLMLYYDERDLEGTTAIDAGAEIRDGMKTIMGQGACPETMWPYDVAQYTQKPPPACYAAARVHRALEYARVPQQRAWLKSTLVAGYPVVFGFAVYESFESQVVARTGVVPMPAHNEALIGGHAVLAVGYDNATAGYICRNSWGASWGMSGYFTLPYAYLEDPGLAADLWRIAEVS